MKTYKDINKEEFYKMSAEEQTQILNAGLSEGLHLESICNTIGVSRKNVSEALRKKWGYMFQKQGEYKKFIKVDENFEALKESKKPAPATKKVTKKVTKEATKEEAQHTSPIKQPEEVIKEHKQTNKKAGYSFDFYYTPAGAVKKIGASVDVEVLKEFEILCNKYNFINNSAHISNALALYVQELNSK